jgi:hypothetical protein
MYMEMRDQYHAAITLSLRIVNWMEICLDPRAGLDAVANRNVPVPFGNRNLIVNFVASLFTDYPG